MNAPLQASCQNHLAVRRAPLPSPPQDPPLPSPHGGRTQQGTRPSRLFRRARGAPPCPGLQWPRELRRSANHLLRWPLRPALPDATGHRRSGRVAPAAFAAGLRRTPRRLPQAPRPDAAPARGGMGASSAVCLRPRHRRDTTTPIPDAVAPGRTTHVPRADKFERPGREPGLVSRAAISGRKSGRSRRSGKGKALSRPAPKKFSKVD